MGVTKEDVVRVVLFRVRGILRLVNRSWWRGIQAIRCMAYLGGERKDGTGE